MKILIANPGSTSYKCKCYDMESMAVLFQAGIERIGDKKGIYSYVFKSEDKVTQNLEIPDYYFAVNLAIETLTQKVSMDALAAIGFKTVHAKDVTGCVELTEDVQNAMREYLPLVPVHNEVYLTAISVFNDVLPDTPLIGLFETAFHTNIPPEAYFYGVPYKYYEKHGVRKYGFHGASHRYIATKVKEDYFPDQDNYKVISCHLGGSSSVCAIKAGISIDTSMGMSAQAGCLNAKRVGDLDSFAMLYIMEKEGLSIQEMRDILISEGGVYGISGISGDFRDITKGMQEGNERATLAFKSFAYHVKRYIGEYLAALNGTDFIVLTGGLGQHSPLMRKEILKDMENIGVVLDDVKNEQVLDAGIVSSDESTIKVLVLETNEELIVAREVEKFLNDN